MRRINLILIDLWNTMYDGRSPWVNRNNTRQRLVEETFDVMSCLSTHSLPFKQLWFTKNMSLAHPYVYCVVPRRFPPLLSLDPLGPLTCRKDTPSCCFQPGPRPPKFRCSYSCLICVCLYEWFRTVYTCHWSFVEFHFWHLVNRYISVHFVFCYCLFTKEGLINFAEWFYI